MSATNNIYGQVHVKTKAFQGFVYGLQYSLVHAFVAAPIISKWNSQANNSSLLKEFFKCQSKHSIVICMMSMTMYSLGTLIHNNEKYFNNQYLRLQDSYPFFKNEKYSGPFILNQGMFFAYTYPIGLLINVAYYGQICRNVFLPYSSLIAMACIQTTIMSK